MAMGEERRSFLLSMTLTELAFVMFFLLLLLASWLLASRDEALATERSERARLEEKLDSVTTWMAENPAASADDFIELLRQTEEAVAAREEAEQERDSLRERFESLEEDSDELEQIRQITEGMDTDEIAELISSREDLRGQLANLQKRCDKAGWDLPPCWADPETGKIEYIYRVRINEGSLDAEPAWPDHRKDDAERIPGALDLPWDTLSTDEFARRALPIREWADQRECRHYVIIEDSAESKESFKSKLLLIEGFFYKYLRRSG